MSTIDLYTTPQCGFCKQLKTLLKETDIAYAEHDVTSSDVLLKEMHDLTRGALSVPVVVINKGTDTIKYAIGFEEGMKLLNLTQEAPNTPKEPAKVARLTCPQCHHIQEAPIPTTSCVPFYICDGCKETIQAAGEDCCVFCSYADRPCPLKKPKESGCSNGVCSLPQK